MDQELVELIPEAAPFFGPNGLVWQVVTDEAKAEYPEENFIVTQTERIRGCIYLGTLAEVQASIEEMNAMKIAHARDIEHAE